MRMRSMTVPFLAFASGALFANATLADEIRYTATGPIRSIYTNPSGPLRDAQIGETLSLEFVVDPSAVPSFVDGDVRQIWRNPGVVLSGQMTLHRFNGVSDSLQLDIGQAQVDVQDNRPVVSRVWDEFDILTLSGEHTARFKVSDQSQSAPSFSDMLSSLDMPTSLVLPPFSGGVIRNIHLFDSVGRIYYEADLETFTIEVLNGDSDNDGLTDDEEIALQGTFGDPNCPDPFIADFDGDGLNDGQEIGVGGEPGTGTDPCVADTDGDGLTDGEEIDLQEFGCPNPLAADTDNDGIDDGIEVDLGLDHCDDADFDGDGLMDSQEILDYETDPTNPDSDGDGVWDGTEVDSGCMDPNDADSDDDGLSDGDEVNGTTLGVMTNPCAADTDGDGIDDLNDPTPDVPGTSSGFIEDWLRGTGTISAGFDLGSIDAPNDNAATGRRNAIANKLAKAANLTADGDYQGAIDELASLLEKLDGEPRPADWMKPGEDRDNLVLDINLAIDWLLIEMQ